MSVHQWGESPQGVWQLEIHNKGRYMGELNRIIYSLLFDELEKIKTLRRMKILSLSSLNAASDFLWNFLSCSEHPSEFALIRGWTLVLYGTVISPQRTYEPRQSFSSNYSLNNYRNGGGGGGGGVNYDTTNPYTTQQQRTQQKSTAAGRGGPAGRRTTPAWPAGASRAAPGPGSRPR